VPAALAVHGLEKRYRATTALAGVDLQVEQGQLFGLLGPNGAGKSTLVKIACGLVHPSAGSATVCGAPAGSIGARGAIGYLAELFRFPGWARATEVLELHQKLAGSNGGAAERSELLALVGLADAAGRRVEALVGSPKLLLLDEPTSALDPVGRRTVRELLEELRRRGMSVLLNSHLLSEVELVCDHVAIISKGALVTSGRPSELARPRGVEVETDDGVKLYPDAGRDDAPRIVAGLAAAGRPIYGVRVLTSTLEDVYLEAVGGETS
jgi:ABC-2 type transport system ATP-binding protein